jgi:hypothetical protein
MEDRGQVHTPAVLSPHPEIQWIRGWICRFVRCSEKTNLLPVLVLKPWSLGRHAAGTTVDSFHCCGSSSVVKQTEWQQAAIQDASLWIVMRIPQALTGWSASRSEPYIKTRWALSRSDILRGNHGISPKSKQKQILIIANNTSLNASTRQMWSSRESWVFSMETCRPSLAFPGTCHCNCLPIPVFYRLTVYQPNAQN